LNEVKHAIVNTPPGTRSILDAAVSGLLQARMLPVLNNNNNNTNSNAHAASVQPAVPLPLTLLLQDGDEGIKSQSLELVLKLCSVDPGQ